MKTIQIIPASGVIATFAESDGKNSYPIVCWGLREEMVDWGDGEEVHYAVVGMVFISGDYELSFVDDGSAAGKFAGYLYE